MKNAKKAVLLINLGTPDDPSVPAVRRYLDQFLMDGRVMDIPYINRNLLVRGIIVPFRSPNSSKLYKEIWDEKTGSPLMKYSILQQQLLQEKLGDDYHVELAMRYQKPSIENALQNLRRMQVEHIRIIPMFPQYASATTGSIIEEVMRILMKWPIFPELSIVNDFYENEMMAEVFAENAQKYNLQDYDHVLFSYHGLPVRQLVNVNSSEDHNCETAGCRERMTEENRFCYLAQCFATSRAIAAKLNLKKDDYTDCFQSRLGKTPWIQPYTSDVLKKLAAEGKKKLLVLCPAFVADCIETIHEIGIEYDEEFKEMGGEEVQLVESLNDHSKWIEVLHRLALNK